MLFQSIIVRHAEQKSAVRIKTKTASIDFVKNAANIVIHTVRVLLTGNGLNNKRYKSSSSSNIMFNGLWLELEIKLYNMDFKLHHSLNN